MQSLRRMKRVQNISRRFFAILRGAGLVMCWLGTLPMPAHARGTYLRPTFNEQYNTTDTRLDACTMCHIGPEPFNVNQLPRNPYGADFEAQPDHRTNPGQALRAIESFDSDTLGINNLAEILALAFPGNPNDEPPLADAGANQSVDENRVVTLDGRASSDRDATGSQRVTFQWEQVAGPQVTLSNPGSARPTFTAPPRPNETLEFELHVTDNEGSTDTASVSILIVAANDPPTADAGDDQTVKEAVLVTLDGSRSSDSEDGSNVQFAWRQIPDPTVTLSDPTSPRPTFTAPRLDGASVVLEFELQVTDTEGLKDTDIVIVNVSNRNRTPTADAGPDQNVTEDDRVTLDGSRSRDPEDGATVRFSWMQLAGPPVSLSNSAVARPTFVAPLVEAAGATLEFELRVTDSEGLVATDVVVIQVMNEADDPTRDSDADGITDVIENTAPNSGDGNDDGVLDSQQAHVATLPTSQNTRHVTLVAPQGISLTSVHVVDNPSPDDIPLRVTFPVGFLEFMLHGLRPGAAVTVTLLLPPGVTSDTYYKFGRTPELAVNHWYEFRFDGRTGVDIAANSVRLHFIDGQRGDEDLTANGVIMDPGGIALRETIFIDEGSDEGGGGGGGGCVVHPGAPFDPLLIGILGYMLAYLGRQWLCRP